MSSIRQIQANRQNALKSTGPVTLEGKERSRCNAVRHGLTAETVIGTLEDANDYTAFEATVIADYDAESAVERELVLRLASLLWRLRRATNIETRLFENQLNELSYGSQSGNAARSYYAALRQARVVSLTDQQGAAVNESASADAAMCFFELAKDPTCPLDRLSRYEALLWRQAGQIIFTLDTLRRRAPRERGRYNFLRPRLPGPYGRED